MVRQKCSGIRRSYLGEKGNETYYIQPQAQLIYMGVHSDNYRDKNNTDIRSSKDNFQTRLGVKALINGFNERIDSGKNRVFQPFVELKLILMEFKLNRKGLKTLVKLSSVLKGNGISASTFGVM